MRVSTEAAATVLRQRGLAIATAVAAWTLCAPASAHPGHNRSSRFVQVDLAADAPRLSYALVFEPAPSDAGRRRADADGDGKVSNDEADAELARMTRALLPQLRICRGRTPEALACSVISESQVTSSAGVGFSERAGKPLAISWEIALEVGDGLTALKLEDRVKDAEIDRTDVQIVPPEGVELLLAGPGANGAPSGVTLEFKWDEDRASSVREVFVAWNAPLSRVLVAGVAGAVTLAMAALLFVASRPRRSAPAA